MKVYSIGCSYFKNCGLINNYSGKTNISSCSNQTDSFTKTIQTPIKPLQYKTISFYGHPVHLLDGGDHATNISHFAQSISPDIDINRINIDCKFKDGGSKNLRSLYSNLKELNARTNIKDEYVAIPIVVALTLKQLEKQCRQDFGEGITITPDNINERREIILEHLKNMYEHPDSYQDTLALLDRYNLGIEYVYPIIQEINKLVEKGAKVFIPSAHPYSGAVKNIADTEDLKPELYHYISTGEDKSGAITAAIDRLKKDNVYQFNLLALSKAHIVTLKDPNVAMDSIYGARDNCVTNTARGVYNFSPIRRNGEVVGYSFSDTNTVEYPIDEFPNNDQVANIINFVGKNINEVVATNLQTIKLKNAIKNGENTNMCDDVLYPINMIYSPQEIKDKKFDLMGDYVDRSLALFFRTNKQDLVIFPKCDCEGNGKPSVQTMWGSCFAVFNAIKRDIQNTDKLSPIDNL